jgi:hypothetical protein
MATWKVAPALAAGCAAILKPSELASLYDMFSSTLTILLRCFVCFSFRVLFTILEPAWSWVKFAKKWAFLQVC